MRQERTLNVEERDAMRHLTDYAERSFRSKRVLRIMGKLYEDGLIDFDPMAGRAELTDAGRAILQR